MRTIKFDQYEFDTPDSEQEVEVVISSSKNARHPTLTKFADEIVGDGSGRNLGPPIAFSSASHFVTDKKLISRVAGIEVASDCAWPCFVVSDEWDWRHILLDADGVFISYRWSTSA